MSPLILDTIVIPLAMGVGFRLVGVRPGRAEALVVGRAVLAPDHAGWSQAQGIFHAVSGSIVFDKTGKVTGDLSMIGVTVPVTLDVTFNNEGPDPLDPTLTKVGFSASTVVKPADFAMGKVADYGLGPDVVVTINAEAFRK